MTASVLLTGFLFAVAGGVVGFAMTKIKRKRATLEQILAGVQTLIEGQRKIMSQISVFSDAMKVYQDRQDAAVAAVQTEVDNLEKQIAAFQNSPGSLSSADQAFLDGVQARASTVADKLDSLAALTPPVVPVVLTDGSLNPDNSPIAPRPVFQSPVDPSMVRVEPATGAPINANPSPTAPVVPATNQAIDPATGLPYGPNVRIDPATGRPAA